MKTVTDLPRRVREIENAWITLADGCRLAARIWLPEDAEQDPVPAIRRSPSVVPLISVFLWIHLLRTTWDEAKRRIALAERGLDFADAGLVFAGRTMTLPDERRNDGEPRGLA